ncbi:MAG: hypothetical protein J6Y55_11175 [Bacteroidales bacterium]|nr:hypothetical protein [Bacteroidales bacterium]
MDTIDELEQRFVVTADKDERDALARLLEIYYKRIMKNQPKDTVMITRDSKMNLRRPEISSFNSDYEYVAGVIRSCKTEGQIETANNLIKNFIQRYKDKLYLNTQYAKSRLLLLMEQQCICNNIVL